jgi:hypothetical protein
MECEKNDVVEGVGLSIRDESLMRNIDHFEIVTRGTYHNFVMSKKLPREPFVGLRKPNL